MKINRLKALVAGLSTLVGGALLVGAQSANVVNVDFTFNGVPLYTVWGLPYTTETKGFLIDSYDIYTDGSGKISGIATAYISGDTSESYLNLIISGSMGNKGTTPIAEMKIKGTGYSDGLGGTGKAKLDLKFVGSPEVVITSEMIDTNIYYYTNTVISGLLNGEFISGIKGEKKQKIKDEPAEISSDNVDVSKNLHLDSYVTLNKNKINVVGWMHPANWLLDESDLSWFDFPFVGNGNSNSKGKFSVNLTGMGDGSGSKVKLSGTEDLVMPTLKNSIGPSGLEISGKIFGQKVKSTDGSISSGDDGMSVELE
jgi:hypothetical protein